ncbi:MAG: hypothetical protein IPN94_04625 [Sphingobacteriales bacterium]|jgi:hypothetical protein|nr:hypothetical protein [Sphingobacteriales bacterium]
MKHILPLFLLLLGVWGCKNTNTTDTAMPAKGVTSRALPSSDPPQYSLNKLYSVSSVTIDTTKADAPDGSVIAEAMHKLVVKDKDGKTVRELLPTEFKQPNLLFIKWVGDNDLIFALSGIFDISDFMLYQISQNKIIPIKYDQSAGIMDSIKTTDRVLWKTKGDSIVDFVIGQ